MPIDSLGEPFDVFRHVSQDITGHGRLRPVNGRLTDGRADGRTGGRTGGRDITEHHTLARHRTSPDMDGSGR